MKSNGKKNSGSSNWTAGGKRLKLSESARNRCPIVGVGASAGGLEAFTQLLKHLPVDTGFGFVLVQHLDPQHKSTLTQLLARATAMPVAEVANNMRVEANHIYVIPPNTSLGIAGGILKLQPRSEIRATHRAIDSFFEALAKDQRESAIGVILSGSATDGTLGLEAIKAEGGLTFAQDDSARFDSMPRSAVAAGCVDLVLSPPEIAKELSRIAKHPFVAGKSLNGLVPSAEAKMRGGRRASARGSFARAKSIRENQAPGAYGTETGPVDSKDEAGYKKILLLLRNHSGVDFSLYKSSTIQRRIMRRTVLNERNTLTDYAAFLRGNAKELNALYSDTLIGVTSFFRNADAFSVLQHKVFPSLLGQSYEQPVRIWVLGCSTGQEPYSIAMAFAEAAQKVAHARKLQMFATDLNEANLNKARHGLYPRSVMQDVSADRLKRFFVEEENGYRVVKALRESIVFARQNVINDPPFSRMDLISCRNLMIYLEPALQKRVIPTFHYALKPEGYLFLGASESIGEFTDLFQAVDKKQKIFLKLATSAQVFQLPVHQEREERPAPGEHSMALTARKKAGGGLDAFRGELSAEREADRVTINHFAPAGVLINSNLQILQFRGSTGAYLEASTGKANFDLLKMAREGLMLPLRATILRAHNEMRTTRHEAVPVTQNGTTRLVNVQVVPLKNLKELCYLVLFEDSEQPGLKAAHTPVMVEGLGDESLSRANKKEEAGRIAGLERDLAETRDYLQSVQEHQESATEELQASNEEGQSANEELQSLNEELETSKEELESTNEELTTVNEEMANRNTDLNRLNADLTNLQTATQFIIILLRRDLTIRRFSDQAGKQFSLVSGDVDRPIQGIRHNLQVPDLSAIIAKVIACGRESEREVQDTGGRWYSLRVRPYLTGDGKVDGAVLALVDIDDLKRTERIITEAHEHAEAIIRTVPNPLITLTADLRVETTNEAFNRTFRISPREMKGRSIFEINHGVWDTPRLRHLLKDVIPKNSFFNEFELTQDFKGIGRRTLLLNARVLNELGGKTKEILLGIQDVTEVVAFQADLRRSEMRFRRLFETAQDGVLILDPQTRKITDANPFIVRLLGCSRKHLINKELWEIGFLKDKAANRRAFVELKAKGFLRYEDLPLETADGRTCDVEFVSNLYDEDGEALIQCNIRDITDRKLSEKALVASEERFRILFDLGPVGVYSCNAQGLIQEFNRCAAALWGRKPAIGAKGERFCGSFKLRRADGSPMPHQKCPMAAVLAGTLTEAHDVEVIIERRDGSRITAIANIIALKNAQGEIIGAINCFYDITARKQAEGALAAARAELDLYAAHLERMVAKRTADLHATNRRLEASVDSNRKGKERYEALFLDSQVMQRKLRKLTHQIITVQEEERKEISRELHDEVVQTLIGINVELASLGQGVIDGMPAVKEKIAHTQRLVAESVTAVHRFARGLRPAVLDDLGLIPALHAHCKAVAAEKNLKIQLTAFRGVESLGGAKRTVLFRVAQEALTNVVRHAKASDVAVTIVEESGVVRMEIHDNGAAFDVEKIFAAKAPSRLGLLGMRERVEMVGGTLAIDSASGKGTTIRAEIPFISKN